MIRAKNKSSVYKKQEKIQKARGLARAFLARAELFTAQPGTVSGRAVKKARGLTRAGPRPTLLLRTVTLS